MELSPEDQIVMGAANAYAQANRKAIAAERTDPHVYLSEKSPVSVFMAGSPGAGKTEASIELLAQHGDRVLRIDPDELRELLPGYEGHNASLFQRAVSTLVNRMLDLAFKQSQTFLLDGTLTNYSIAAHNIDRSLQRKRVVQILYVYQEPHQAWEFVQEREALDGRHIPPEQFIHQYFEARNVVNRLKKTFGRSISVDLLLKNIDGTNGMYVDNIDLIDGHIPEKYDETALRRILSTI
ncbi:MULTISPECIES: zeta toxin family protein [unclassified Lysobacter]